MRIEQSGSMNTVTSVSNAGNARTESTANKQTSKQSEQTTSIKDVQEMTSVKKMEHYQQEIQKETEDKTEDQEKDVLRAIEQANKQIKSYGRKLEFSIHDETKEIMVKVINTDDDSIIREVPSEKVLDMVARMWDMAGIMVDEKR